jgi:hypothetical protein
MRRLPASPAQRSALVLSFALTFAVSAGVAGVCPALAQSDLPLARAKNAGTIEGEVVAVDYRAGTIVVQSGGRRVDVVVLPSTNIQGHDNFHTIADIAKGSRVTVILSERAGTFIAQIIRLR